MPVISLDSVQRSFGDDEPALAGVSLEVHAGEVVGLVGCNGAGKTTLLRVALGLLHPDRGSVRLFGLDPWAHAVEVKRRIGCVLDAADCFGRVCARQLFDLHAALYPSWDEQLALRLLGPLARQLTTRVDRLSKGQMGRVMLTCAMAHRPELLVLDEPAAGLDPSARREFLELAIELLNDAGSTIVFSSHQMSDIERIAGRVVILDHGSKLIDQDLDALKQQHCVALLPTLPEQLFSALEQAPGFVRRRAHGNAQHAVFALEPEAAEAELRQRLRLPDVRCVRVNLEELFIHLVGSER